jgi:hypothetical protein
MAARRLTKGIHSTNRPGMNGVHGYAARSAWFQRFISRRWCLSI